MKIDDENFQIRVFSSDVRVYIRRLFTSLLTVGTLKSWLLSTFVTQMSGQTRFLGEGTRAVWTWKPLCLGKRIRPSHYRLNDDAGMGTLRVAMGLRGLLSC